MKDQKSSGRRVRNIVLTALLALLCIGGVELAACRHFAPATYERIVAPARYAAAVVVDTSRTAVNAAAHFCREVGTQAVRFGSWTIEQIAGLAEQAAANWEDFMSGPEEIILELDETAPPTQDPGPSDTDPPVTEVMEVDGRQILTGGSMDVVYFCQSDEEWADQLYGTDPIGPYGCGPTAMAIVVASMTDTDTDPARMADWVVEHGYWARGSGSYHSIVQGVARGFGLEAKSITERTPEEVLQILESGGMVVALMGQGHFTNGGHFIVLRGVGPTGEVLVADPNSLERSLELWDPQLILDELSSARDNGAPLWAVTQPDT